MGFLERVAGLPSLGLGVSTEYGAPDAPGSLDILALRRRFPQYAQFLEIGVEVEKGLDRSASAWLAQRLPSTYHFLDINLDEPADFDADWMEGFRELVEQVQPAWVCGDAGLWHFGRRDRGQLLLLPPILCDSAVDGLVEGLQYLRQATGKEVLPENPPGAVYLGPLHLLEFFARVAERADTGLVLDCAHLAIYQRMTGRDPLAGLADFPLDRVVEVHIAGGRFQSRNGFSWIEDDHAPSVLDETWSIFQRVLEGAVNLKAVVFECERNPLEDNLASMKKIMDLWEGRSPRLQSLPPRSRSADGISRVQAQRLQQAVVGLLHDPARVSALYQEKAWEGMEPESVALLLSVDRRAWGTDEYRRSRLLQACLEEYPVSAAVVGVSGLDAFFSSKAFYDCIGSRGAMSVAFGAWLSPRVGSLAMLEAAVARSRRPEGESEGWRLAPGVAPLELAEGTLGAWQRFRQQLGEEPLARLAAGFRVKRPKEGKKLEWLLVQPGPEGPSVGTLSRTVYRLLAFLTRSRTQAEVGGELRRLGAAAGEEEEILGGLVEDGVVQRP